MKSTLIAGILLLLSIAGKAQTAMEADLNKRIKDCRRYSWYWAGIGAGVAGLTTVGYYQRPNDQNYIVKVGSSLGAVCVYGIILNQVLKHKYKNQLKAMGTTFYLEPATDNIGLVVKF